MLLSSLVICPLITSSLTIKCVGFCEQIIVFGIFNFIFLVSVYLVNSFCRPRCHKRCCCSPVFVLLCNLSCFFRSIGAELDSTFKTGILLPLAPYIICGAIVFKSFIVCCSGFDWDRRKIFCCCHLHIAER